jgi:arylsulfatase A-like enzyme
MMLPAKWVVNTIRLNVPMDAASPRASEEGPMQRNSRNAMTLAVAWLLLVGATLGPLSGHADEPARPPNVVFILADDLGYGELGCYGQTKIRTPRLDRLASEGMRFTQHYSGSPVCAPSRCVLLTGKHPGHAIVRDNVATPPEGQYPLPANTVTLPRLFQKAGYATGAFGKWGLGGPGSTGTPNLQGIDRFFGYLCQGKAHNFYPTYLWDNDRKLTLNNPEMKLPDRLPAGADPADPASYKAFTGKQYSADLIFAQARQFIRDHKDRPFFLFVPTTIPHLALQVPEDSLAEYRGKWDDPPYPGGKGYLPQHAPRAAYAAMVTRMDREVGRIVDLIQELGLDEQTIFVFSSDNGPLDGRYGGTDSDFFGSTAGLRGYKGSLYEGGIRVPCVVRWKGHIRPGSVSDRVTGFEDWLPTLLELTGHTKAIPPGVDGISFVPTLRGEKQPPRPFLYREYPNDGGQQSIRIGDWKGVRQGLLPRGDARPRLAIELYDLGKDRGEVRDVAAEHSDIVKVMERAFQEQHTPSKDFPIPVLDKK